MITSDNALRLIESLKSGQQNDLPAIINGIDSWATHAMEAIERQDYQLAKNCIGVIQTVIGKR